MGFFSQPSKVKGQPNWLASALRIENFLPGLIVGFLLGLFVELPKRSGWIPGRIPPSPSTDGTSKKKRGGGQSRAGVALTNAGELKMVFVVRQDLKMGEGKIASQCAHAAVGIYDELLKRQPQLVWKWEQCGQPKIVVTCRNQQEMNELRTKAERAGLPTFMVADAGRTQVAAGSKTVLVVGPGWFKISSYINYLFPDASPSTYICFSLTLRDDEYIEKQDKSGVEKSYRKDMA